jgi:hypothetical protein
MPFGTKHLDVTYIQKQPHFLFLFFDIYYFLPSVYPPVALARSIIFIYSSFHAIPHTPAIASGTLSSG